MSTSLVLITNDLEETDQRGRDLIASIVVDNGHGRLVIESTTKIVLEQKLQSKDSRDAPGFSAHAPSVHYISAQPFGKSAGDQCMTLAIVNAKGDAIIYPTTNLKIDKGEGFIFDHYASKDGHIDILTAPDVPAVVICGSRTKDPRAAASGLVFQAWGSANNQGEPELKDWLRTTIRIREEDQGHVPSFEAVTGGEGLGHFAAYRDNQGHMYIRTISRQDFANGREADKTFWSLHAVEKKVRSRSIPALVNTLSDRNRLHIFYVDWDYHLRHFTIAVDDNGKIASPQASGEIIATGDNIITPTEDLNWKDLRPRALLYDGALYCFFGISGANKGKGMGNPDRKVAYVKYSEQEKTWSRTMILDVRMPDSYDLAGFGIAEVPRAAIGR
ncbi:hypothetical protein ACN47E_002007 [Coniothyrium glycines]